MLTLHIPPLRARPADILPLAEHFCARYARANGLPVRTLSSPARHALAAHGWPGNVRELENCMHRAVLLAEGEEIGPEAIEMLALRAAGGADAARQVADPPAAPVAWAGQGRMATLVGRKVEDVERELILETLSHCLGNRTRAAEILGISIRTLRNKLHEYRAAGAVVPPVAGQPLPALTGAA